VQEFCNPHKIGLYFTTKGVLQMSKSIKVFFFIACGAFIFYATVNAQSGIVIPAATATPRPSPTPTATTTPETCRVKTNTDNGKVNLRTCGSTSCAVINILTENTSLKIISKSNWLKVSTANGTEGYINSVFCEAK
jgi:SH3-like domain-containing protein